jgi:hypothetical protein
VLVTTVKTTESHKFDPTRKLVAITSVQQQGDWVRQYIYAAKTAKQKRKSGRREAHNESSISSEAR